MKLLPTGNSMIASLEQSISGNADLEGARIIKELGRLFTLAE